MHHGKSAEIEHWATGPFCIYLFFLFLIVLSMRTFLFFISLLFLAGCSLQSSGDSSSERTSSDSGAYRAELDPDERIVLAKKRRSYMNGIRK